MKCTRNVTFLNTSVPVSRVCITPYNLKVWVFSERSLEDTFSHVRCWYKHDIWFCIFSAMYSASVGWRNDERYVPERMTTVGGLV